MTIIGNELRQETIENIKRGGIPVIIFGAATVGEVLFQACHNLGIKVECFCDNNINKTKKTLCGIEVVYVPDLKTKYKNAIFLISAADIKDVVEQLHSLNYSKWYAGSLFLRDFDIYQYEFSVPMDFVEYVVSTCILCHDNYLIPDKLFLRSVDIIITERCSLKCRDCSNLMRYYEKPIDCNTREVMQTIDRFFNIVDDVNEFRVIGGEPFMNKEFHLIAKRLIDEPKVKKIVIYTNGTIVPRGDQIEYLKNEKVLVLITDYGELSRNLKPLIQILQQNKVSVYAEKAWGWTNCAKIGRHNRNPEQQKKIFNDCCAKNLITLSNGKLYRCPFVANAHRLCAVPKFKEDYINIFEDSVDISEMKKKIRGYLLKKDFLKVCDYCNGRSFGDPEIQPAIQIDKPIEYKKYS